MLEAAGIALDTKTITLLLYGLSIAADSIPILGNIKGLIEAVVGYDLITGQPLSKWERIMNGISSVNPFTVLKAVAGAAGAAGLAYGISKAVKAKRAAEAVEETAEAVTKTGGRLGSKATRQQNKQIADYLESKGYEITGGGGKVKEEYLPGPGGKRKGSNFVDITAQKDGKTTRINTVDTYANGKPTTREATAAESIKLKTPGDDLILIPKGSGLGDLSNLLD